VVKKSIKKDDQDPKNQKKEQKVSQSINEEQIEIKDKFVMKIMNKGKLS
jgi:hypothetical protein